MSVEAKKEQAAEDRAGYAIAPPGAGRPGDEGMKAMKLKVE